MISDNLRQIHATIEQAARRAGRDPNSIQLVAVSKHVAPERILEAVSCGQTLFGENYIQEAANKISQLDQKVRWHFIGHLQSNKARQAAALFDMVETVDRLKTAVALDSQAQQVQKQLAVLLQVNVAGEQQKSGIAPEEAEQLLHAIREQTSLQVRGLMTMPPFFDDPEKSRPYFKSLRELAKHLAALGLFHDNGNVELSMGMSADFPVAIEEGATIIRVGTALFGKRN